MTDRLPAAAAASIAVLHLWAAPAGAHQEALADHADHEEAAADDGDAGPDDWTADLVVTDHRMEARGETIEYTATTGRMPIPDYEGEPRADVFFIAYTRTDVDPGAPRPVTFTFNGGPGSSSVWLHLGSLGPRRVVFGAEGEPLPPPAKLADNEWTWLDFTDLVFIDPVSTGFSRPAEGVDKSEFHGLERDVESVGEFVRLYCTRYGRWDDPKFLCGESYGTTRAAGLAAHLQGRHGMYLNGISFVSPILDFQTARFNVNNDLPYILFLPTYTATAWYHNRLGGDLQDGSLEDAVAAAERFAKNDYALALLKGAELPAAQHDAAARRLSQLTGLSVDFIEGMNLRVDIGNFTKELLRDEGRTVGRFDSRYTGRDRVAAGTRHEYDPSYAVIQGPFSKAINAYLREELGYESDHPYEVLTGRVRPWDYSSHTNRYVNVADELREAMVRNPALHALFAAGYYDLATPHFAMMHTVAHLNLPEELRDNVETAFYPAGHMMYLRDADRAKIHRDAEAMYERALNASMPPVLGR